MDTSTKKTIQIGLELFAHDTLYLRKIRPADIGIIKFNLNLSRCNNRATAYGYVRSFMEAKSLAYRPEILADYEWPEILALLDRFAGLISPHNKGYRIYDHTVGAKIPTHGTVPRLMEFIAKDFLYGTCDADMLYDRFHKTLPYNRYNTLIADLMWRMAKTQELGEWPEGPPKTCLYQWTT